MRAQRFLMLIQKLVGLEQVVLVKLVVQEMVELVKITVAKLELEQVLQSLAF